MFYLSLIVTHRLSLSLSGSLCLIFFQFLYLPIFFAAIISSLLFFSLPLSFSSLSLSLFHLHAHARTHRKTETHTQTHLYAVSLILDNVEKMC